MPGIFTLMLCSTVQALYRVPPSLAGQRHVHWETRSDISPRSSAGRPLSASPWHDPLALYGAFAAVQAEESDVAQVAESDLKGGLFGADISNADAARSALLLATTIYVASFAIAAPAEAATAAGVDATTTSTAVATAAVLTPNEILSKATKRALGGGLSGALAGVFQVLTLMWLRTTMNYQYRNGGSTQEALSALYEEGGVRRFYRGVGFALFQTPLSRFGDTAANSGVLALLIDSDLPIGVRTALASGAASVWRIGLTPLDTVKTTLQVTGEEGLAKIRAKVADGGPTVLFQGALANAAASFAGNYPWYLTFNSLNEALPSFGEDLSQVSVTEGLPAHASPT